MITFKEVDGVWNFGSVINGDDCDNQTIKEAVLTWKGENFANINDGIGWYNFINSTSGRHEMQEELKSELTKVILETNLVRDVEYINIIDNNGKLVLQYSVILLNTNNRATNEVNVYDDK